MNSTGLIKLSKSGKCIEFGSYPQSEVKDDERREKLTKISEDIGVWKSFDYFMSGETSDYMKYMDVELDGEKYRGVLFTNYRPYFVGGGTKSFQKVNGFETNVIYWFKYEPITWDILEENNGDIFVVASNIIDAHEYNSADNNNYKNASLRKWLNDSLYKTAFSEEEQGLIKTTVVDNSLSSTGCKENENVCENTSDKVFLLSTKEVITFYKDGVYKSATAYAKAQGRFSGWWLRSPASTLGYNEQIVDNDGRISTTYVCHTDGAVVPALHLNNN